MWATFALQQLAVPHANLKILADGVHGAGLMQEVKFQPDLARQLIHRRDQVELYLCPLRK